MKQRRARVGPLVWGVALLLLLPATPGEALGLVGGVLLWIGIVRLWIGIVRSVRRPPPARDDLRSLLHGIAHSTDEESRRVEAALIAMRARANREGPHVWSEPQEEGDTPLAM